MQPTDMTNTELMREIERTRKLLVALQDERDHRERVIRLHPSPERWEAHLAQARPLRDAIRRAQEATSAVYAAMAAAEEAGDTAEVRRLTDEVLPPLLVAERSAIEAGWEVLL